MYTNGTVTHPFRWFKQEYPNKSLPKDPTNWDLPDGPWWFADPEPAPEIPIEQHRQNNKTRVRTEAETLYAQPVTLADGSVWNGGFPSAVAIAQAAELSKFMGQSMVAVYAFDNTEYTVSHLTAKQIAAAIGSDYQIKFAAKQAAMRALDEVPNAAPDAVAQMEAITVAAYLS